MFWEKNKNPSVKFFTLPLYVSEFGSDSEGNGTFENPFATIKKAYEYGMQQNTYNMYIKTIGTLKGTGNVLLNLKPYMNLTIVGVDKETSIIDAESSKYIFNIEPYDYNLRVTLENLTIENGAPGYTASSYNVGLIRVAGKHLTVENCLFNNVSGYALSLEKVYDSEAIINNSQFINSAGAYFSEYSKNTYITNSIFINNTVNPTYGVINVVNSNSDGDEYDCQLYMDNLTFDGTYSNDGSSEWNHFANIYIKGVNATLSNSLIENSVNCSAITAWTANYVNKAFISIINSTLENNYFDFSAGYMGQESPRPTIELINTNIINGGGINSPDLRYQNVWWNVINSSFINMAKEMVFNGADIKPNNTVFKQVVNITNTLFLNNPNGIKIVQGNISESAFYNTTLNVADANYGGSQPAAVIVYLDNNYWNDLTPNYNITASKYTVYCDKWIVPGLVNDNEPGYNQTITLAYMQFDGENYTEYDTSNMAIFDENYTMSVSDGTITPTSGILTRNDELLFNYIVDSLGNKTITAKLTNGLSVKLIVTFYKVETQLNLTLDSDKVYQGENLTINVALADKDANLINGSVDIYLNGYLTDTIDVINGEGILSIIMDKMPRVYEVFANYTGDNHYQSAVNSTTFTLLNNEMNVTVKNNNSHDNVTFDISFNYPANGTADVTIGNDTYTTPVEDGAAKLVIPPMDIGEYEALVSYNGIVNQTVPFNITRDTKTNIKAEDVEMYYKDGTQLNITLTDAYDKALANENVIVTIGDEIINATTNDKGIASVDLDLDSGNYTAIISYAGSETQDAANATANIVVLYNSTSIIIGYDVNVYYDNAAVLNVTLINVYGDALANEEVVVSVNGTEYTNTTDSEGVAIFNINLNVGEYTADIKYAGSETQDPANTTADITVLTNTSTIIVADDLVMYYKNGSRFYITLTDALGNPLANESIKIDLNGYNYTRTTNANGTASIAINLNVGNYNATVYYDGSETQDAANKTVNIDVLSTINGKDVTKIFRNGTQYYATFTDGQGNPLAEGTMVRFNINGVMYDRKVNANGTAKLNINLEQGTYILTAIHPDNGEMASNVITVLPKIAENHDLVKYYRNGSQYVVRLLGDDGNPVGANEVVTFNINGVMYERKTNESGYAKLNINLQPGDYIITAMYGGCNVANNITVKPVLNASDIKMTYKDGTKFKATLVDGQGKPYAGQNITFNIHGVFYDRTTDSTGTAALNINLMAGEYIITSSYNESNIANTITITN